MKTTVRIQNIKCDSCAREIENRINLLDGISKAKANPEKKTLTFYFRTHNALESVRMEMSKIGYPFEGEKIL